MCGIAGIVNNRGVDQITLSKMRDSMRHRGPDDKGIWISPNSRVGLAHRRLSIIDLSEAGRQPMSDSEGMIWITFNGEIYNFKDIREELINKGYRFKSDTDTEVIINSYKEWGRDCLEKFNGMFAFCIYDDRKKLLFLARDRLGKKPLYYISDSGAFVFASEIKAFLKYNGFSKEIDISAFNHYLTFGYIPGELSIFTSVRKLLPGYAMIYDIESGDINTWSYWDAPVYKGGYTSENELIDDLDKILEDAVRLRMISDVPLGAFLSGGVDSSLIVAMMSRISDRPVKTFSIGFNEAKYNELPYASIVAKHFGTEHHEVILSPNMFSVLPELVRQFDEPFADSSMLPMYFVSKETRKSVTVALSGDGGDEIFGGYQVYRACVFDKYMRMLVPGPARKVMLKTANYFPINRMSKIQKQFLMLRFGLEEAFIERCIHANFRSSQRMQLLADDVYLALGDDFYAPERSRDGYLKKRKDSFINRITYTDMKTYLPDDIMVKVDRASMMVSLEARAPFLDYRIAEFSFKHIPASMKVKGMTTKYLLKKLAKRLLPEDLDINRKMGFSIPVSEWFRGPLSGQVKEIIFSANSELFNMDYVQTLFDGHMNGYDNSTRLYSLLVFALWRNEYLNNA